MSVIYIAGPITGNPNYKDHFKNAADRLGRENIVFNPATMPEGLPHAAYMPICYAMMDACDTAYFIKGWEQSVGARTEYDYATGKSMKVMFESDEPLDFDE